MSREDILRLRKQVDGMAGPLPEAYWFRENGQPIAHLSWDALMKRIVEREADRRKIDYDFGNAYHVGLATCEDTGGIIVGESDLTWENWGAAVTNFILRRALHEPMTETDWIELRAMLIEMDYQTCNEDNDVDTKGNVSALAQYLLLTAFSKQAFTETMGRRLREVKGFNELTTLVMAENGFVN